MSDAVVIGAGPNGLVAANLLADAGWSVEVVEEQPEPGGAVKTAEVTLPGFRHDLFSAFYPLTAASPVIRAFELERHGLRWCHGPLVLAHPSSDGSAVVLSRDLDETAASLDAFAPGDGDAWRGLYERLWLRIGDDVLDAMTRPLPAAAPVARMLATLGAGGALQLGRIGISSVRRFTDEWFDGAGAARLFAGNALHADLVPETPPSAFFGLLLCFLGQQVGYPFPEGGAGSLSAALVRRLESRGGSVRCGVRAANVIVRRGAAVGVRLADGTELEAKRAVLAAVDAPQLFLSLVGRDALPARTLRDLRRFEWDPSTFKVDWALDGPIPWTNDDVRRAPVVHIADGVDALQKHAGELARGLIPADPFLIFGQYAIGDPTRAPAGKETAWAYTHIPQQIRGDARGELSGVAGGTEQERFVERMEQQIEALAPGFQDLVLARHVLTPKELEARNASLHNGALNGGTAQLHQQLVFRPTVGLGRPETPVARLYLASSSAHPGGGVHGAPGAIAARTALRGARTQRTLFALGVAATAVALRRR